MNMCFLCKLGEEYKRKVSVACVRMHENNDRSDADRAMREGDAGAVDSAQLAAGLLLLPSHQVEDDATGGAGS